MREGEARTDGAARVDRDEVPRAMKSDAGRNRKLLHFFNRRNFELQFSRLREMDAAALHSVLQATLVPDNATRNAAEAQLKTLRTHPGFLVALLQIASHHEVAKPLRQAAGVILKNAIGRRWAHVPPEDQAPIRANILEVALGETDSSMRDLLCECVKGIAQDEFPGCAHGTPPVEWTVLMPTIHRDLQTQDVTHTMNALFILQGLVDKFTYRRGALRGPMTMLVDTCFPLVLAIFQKVSLFIYFRAII